MQEQIACEEICDLCCVDLYLEDAIGQYHVESRGIFCECDVLRGAMKHQPGCFPSYAEKSTHDHERSHTNDGRENVVGNCGEVLGVMRPIKFLLSRYFSVSTRDITSTAGTGVRSPEGHAERYSGAALPSADWLSACVHDQRTEHSRHWHRHRGGSTDIPAVHPQRFTSGGRGRLKPPATRPHMLANASARSIERRDTRTLVQVAR